MLLVCRVLAHRCVRRLAQFCHFVSMLRCRSWKLNFNCSIACRVSLDLGNAAGFHTLLLFRSGLWAWLSLVVTSSVCVADHATRLNDFLENLVLFEVAAGWQRVRTVAFPSLLCDHALVLLLLLGLLVENIAMTQVWDAGFIALVTMIYRKVTAKAFLHVSSVHFGVLLQGRLPLLNIDALGNGVVVLLLSCEAGR